MRINLAYTEFQNHVHNVLKTQFPQSEGWQILKQPTTTSRVRPDFLVNGHGTTVVVANENDQVETSDIDNLLDCLKELKARNAIIYTTNDTKIPGDVAEYAKAKGVELTRTKWWQDD
jgi:hypothetical protein